MPDVGEVLLNVLIVLVFAKLAAEASERVGVPAVVGEIVAGLLIGPSLLGLVGDDQTLRVLAELGVILLLLDVGLHMDLADLTAVGRSALSVAVVGVVVPFVAGYAVALGLGLDGRQPLFLGAALTATSVGITARVFGDLRALSSSEARTVLGAAVADDVIGLVILTVVVRIADGGDVSPLGVAGVIALATGFLVVSGWLGIRLGPWLFDRVQAHARSSGTLVALALAYALGLAELATLARLAPIVGAFAAGLSLSRSHAAEQIRRELTPVGHLFIPVFFLQIGIDARIGAFGRPAVLALAGALLVVGVAGKVVAGLAAGRVGADRLLIGLGMIPRGEVGLIFAGIGLRDGILGPDPYAALLLVVLLSTVMTPPLLRWRLLRLRPAPTAVPIAEPMPAHGWLAVDDGHVELAATPPATSRLVVALEAARRCRDDLRPGERLVAWLEATSQVAPTWDGDATRALFALLREGDVRSWRFLEVTGVLGRALPELAEALHRRRADPHDLNPASAFTWSLVDAVRRTMHRDELGRRAAAPLPHPERLLLAALVLDCAGDDRPVVVARRLVARLDMSAQAEQDIAGLVADAGLLRAAAARLDALREEHVLTLAAHLHSAARARMLYLLTIAYGDLEVWERSLLDELHGLVLAALAQPGVADRDTRNLVERRRAEAIRLAGRDQQVIERIDAAPRGYLLCESAPDVARHAKLLRPLPPRGRVRVYTAPLSTPHEWRVDVAGRDREGLLASVTQALARVDADVLDATVATWPDGAAVESFRVRGRSVPDPSVIEAAVAAAFDQPLTSPAVRDAEVVWDDEGSPWYTLCTITAADRPGLLHSFAVALAGAGAQVHAAEVTTAEGDAVDRFSLTDRTSRKLDPQLREAVETALRKGAVVRRRRLGGGLHTLGTSRKHGGHRAETAAS